MHLLQAGIDVAVTALWLGRESIETTHIYVEADLAGTGTYRASEFLGSPI